MKHFFTILLVTTIALSLQAQKEDSKIWKSKNPKGMEFIPPGSFDYDNGTVKKTITVQGFWMSNEITNKEFREFYEDIKANPDSSFSWYDHNNRNNLKTIKYSEILDSLIDQSVWANVPGFEDYFISKAFDKFPVTGISYQSAQYYCWWKSKKENSKLKNYQYLNEYRLPSRIEWEYAAYFETKKHIPISTKNDKPMKVKSGEPVEFGLYNMFDNAAEFVWDNDKGTPMIVKFSWKDSNPSEVYSNTEKEFRNYYTGFRIVRTFINSKKNSKFDKKN